METIYLGHDNAVRLVCKENSSAIDTSVLTKAAIQLNVLVDSTAADAGYLRWNQSGYESGEVRLYLGMATVISPGKYKAPLILYDATSPNGIVWGTIELKVEKDPAGSTST